MQPFEHKFYSKSPKEQQKVLILIGFISAIIALIIIALAIIFKFLFLIFLLAILLQIIAPFFDAPSGRKSGNLIYYSPLFITTKERKGKIIIHGGTLFDYIFTLEPHWTGQQRTKSILLGYLWGMIHFIEAHENQGKEHIKVMGTSYIINERTAEKIGLKATKTDIGQLFILLFNYIPLTISYSYAKGRLSFPNIFKIKTYAGTVGDLIDKKAYLQALANRFSVIH